MAGLDLFVKENYLTKEEAQFSENWILNNQLPMTYCAHATDSDEHEILFHILRNNHTKAIQSDNNFFFENITRRFAKECGIKINTFLRASINVTLPQKDKHSTPKLDQNFFHYNCLIYLDDADGDTVILNEHHIKPQKNKILLFGPHEHYNFYPKYGRRIIAILNFR